MMDTLLHAGREQGSDYALAEGLGLALVTIDANGELRGLTSVGRAVMRLECDPPTRGLATTLEQMSRTHPNDVGGMDPVGGSHHGLLCLNDPEAGRRLFEVRSCRAPDLRHEGPRIYALLERTDYLLTTEALADSERRFTSFADHLPGLAWIKDAAGRLIWANQHFQANFQGRRSAWIYRDDAEVWGQDLGPVLRRGDLVVLGSGVPSISDEMLGFAGARQLWRLSRFLIRSTDAGWHLGCVAFPLDQIANVETSPATAKTHLPKPTPVQAQRGLPDLGQALVWQLQQELLTAQLATRGLQDASQGKPSTATPASCLRGVQALELAPRLLESLEASIAGRPLPLRPEWVDISQLGSELVPEVAQRHAKTKPRFSIEAGVQVWADRVLLRLVLSQLLENACKFAALVGSPMVSIEGLPGAPRQGFRVRDNGPGFEPRQAEGIFHAFGRLPEVIDVPGLGLGLALVAGVIAGHGGRVWADGRLGEGAVFAVSLPLPEQAFE